MKTYVGTRGPTGCLVTVDGRPLPKRADLYNHSTGYEWGYSGSGPAQLALAILADHFNGGPDGKRAAVALHQMFKADIIARMPHYAWRMTEASVAAWVAGRRDG